MQALQRLHPGGLEDDWADKMAAQEYFSSNQQATFEHYIQVRLMPLQPEVACPFPNSSHSTQIMKSGKLARPSTGAAGQGLPSARLQGVGDEPKTCMVRWWPQMAD